MFEIMMRQFDTTHFEIVDKGNVCLGGGGGLMQLIAVGATIIYQRTHVIHTLPIRETQ